MTENLLKQPIAIIGASSMVASRFCDLASKSLNLIKADLNGEDTIDITKYSSVEDFFKRNNFSVAILFSAFTEVDAAEAQRGDKKGFCWKINVDGVNNVVLACKKYRKKLIFISTDFVFDGQNGPYPENEKISSNKKLLSWYGITKVEGEKIITKSLKDAIILRISYPYRGRFEQKDDVLKRIVKLAYEKKLYPMFADQQITPTFIDDLYPAIKLLIQKNQSGIFHLASPKLTTQFEVAKKVLSTFKFKNLKLEKGSLKEFLKQQNRTPRPVVGGLLVNKISELGFVPTDWEKGIKIVYNQSKGKLI